MVRDAVRRGAGKRAGERSGGLKAPACRELRATLSRAEWRGADRCYQL